jgi:hypothetical protein
LQLEQVKASDSDWTWRRSGGRNPGVAWGRRRLGRVRDQRLAEACGVPGPAGFFATVVVSVVCDRRMAASLITTAMSARRIVTTHSQQPTSHAVLARLSHWLRSAGSSAAAREGPVQFSGERRIVQSNFGCSPSPRGVVRFSHLRDKSIPGPGHPYMSRSLRFHVCPHTTTSLSPTIHLPAVATASAPSTMQR